MVRSEVELLVTAADIPESIVVDISELEIGDNATIANVKLPEGCKPVIDRDFVIAQVSAPSGLASASDDEEAKAKQKHQQRAAKSNLPTLLSKIETGSPWAARFSLPAYGFC